MDVLWATIEQLGAVRVLKTSFVAYPVVNALHILAIGALVSSVLLMDLRILGAFRSLPEEPFVRLLRRVALGAFVVALATGAALFSIRAREYAAMPLFWIKMALIGVAGLNFLAHSAWEKRGRSVRGLVAVSIAIWPAILLAGRFLGFV